MSIAIIDGICPAKDFPDWTLLIAPSLSLRFAWSSRACLRSSARFETPGIAFFQISCRLHGTIWPLFLYPFNFYALARERAAPT